MHKFNRPTILFSITYFEIIYFYPECYFYFNYILIYVYFVKTLLFIKINLYFSISFEFFHSNLLNFHVYSFIKNEVYRLCINKDRIKIPMKTQFSC